MAGNNGQLVLNLLQKHDGSATLGTIVSEVAEAAGVPPRDVRQSVKETLDAGVRYGFLEKVNRKFTAHPVNIAELAERVEKEANEANEATEANEANAGMAYEDEQEHEFSELQEKGRRRKGGKKKRAAARRRANRRRK